MCESDDEIRFHSSFLVTMAAAVESVSSSSSNYSSAGDSLSAKLDAVTEGLRANGSACQPVVGEDEALIERFLPRELLLRVFSFLDIISLCRAAQVSR